MSLKYIPVIQANQVVRVSRDRRVLLFHPVVPAVQVALSDQVHCLRTSATRPLDPETERLVINSVQFQQEYLACFLIGRITLSMAIFRDYCGLT